MHIGVRDLDTNMPFGKYDGATIRKVLEVNPQYLQWCVETIKWFTVTRSLRKKIYAAASKQEDDARDYYPLDTYEFCDRD
jgi:hypothetical protein